MKQFCMLLMNVIDKGKEGIEKEFADGGEYKYMQNSVYGRAKYAMSDPIPKSNRVDS